MAFSALLLILAVAASEPPAQAVRVERPEAVAERAAAAARSGRWRAFAETLHPEARDQLKSVMLLMATQGKGEEKALEPEAAELFAINSLAELAALDPVAVSEKFFLGLEKQIPLLRDLLSGSRMTILGSVPEGDDIHLVQRSTVAISGREISKVEVITLRRFDGEWKMLLKTDMAAMIEALASQASASE